MTNRISNPFHWVPDSDGAPVPGGLLYTHAAGTLDDLVTYQDEDGTPNTNPVVMDADGKATVILDGNYRLIFRDALGNLIYDVDDVSSQDLVEWINERVATFVSSTVVTIPGDQTDTYQVNRGVKIDNNPAIVYSTCASVSYDAGPDVTTITVNDAVITSGVVDIATSVVGPDSGLNNALILALAAATGAATIGSTGPSNVQADINARVLTATLTAATGAAAIGSAGSSTVQADIDATNTALLEIMPIGGVILWPGSTVPNALFLEIDGSSFSAVTYPDLDAIYGGTLPDMRAEFPRGWDNGRGVDSGRAILSTQAQAIQAHTHSFTAYGSDGTTAVETANTTGSTFNQVTSSTGGAETRPRNVAWMFIVRAL